MVTTRAIKSKVLFRYEKLLDSCYICGLSDHVDKDCPTLFKTLESETRGKRQFGPRLRVEG